MTRLERFMQKVVKKTEVTSPNVNTPCWYWIGSTSGSGYGQFWNGERSMPAHLFLILIEGRKLLNGQEGCHKCDNKLCVRPSHIFLGTRTANMRDCVNKGRLNPQNGCMAMLKVRKPKLGSSNHESKLTESDVQMVKSIKPAYGFGRLIARKLKVSETVISGIWKGKRWAHITPDATAAQRAEAFVKTIGKWRDE